MKDKDRDRDTQMGARKQSGGVWAAGFVATLGVLCVLAVLVGAGAGCQNRAGMTCQQQSDCNAGLLCNKPPNAGPMSFGICEPGLHGLGEVCVSSAECDVGLVCSTELGQPSEDGWHGVCQAGPPADLAVSDQAVMVPPDLGMASDASTDL